MSIYKRKEKIVIITDIKQKRVLLKFMKVCFRKNG